MDDSTLKNLLEQKMKDMEIMNTSNNTFSSDDSSDTRRSTLDLQEVQKKYDAPSSAVSSKDSSEAEIVETPQSSGNVFVKMVRAKDRNQDLVNPINSRTIILDENGILGSQG